MNITQALPTADAVLLLEPEELAPYLLEHLAANDQNNGLFHLNSLLNSGYGGSLMKAYANDERVANAFREAWSWLAREGLLIERDNGHHFISRRGQRLKGTVDFDAYRRSNVLPRASLHPIIAEKVWSPFVRGEYETAVFQAFKEVEVAVRSAGGFTDNDTGVGLMTAALKPSGGKLTDSTLVQAERLAMLNLFTAAIGLFRNPSAHRHMVLSSPSEAAEMISFASLLMRIVDARAAAKKLLTATI